jgi:hypothetical protein
MDYIHDGLNRLWLVEGRKNGILKAGLLGQERAGVFD